MNRALYPAFAVLATLFSLTPVQAQSYKLIDTGHLGDNLVVDGDAYSISPTGTVGGSSRTGTYRGYRWQNGAISELDDIKDASGYTYVRGINSAGVAVGVCADYFEPEDRFARWQGTAVTNLGSLSGGTGTALADAAAFAINDNGLIVGYSSTSASYQEHAVYYDTAFHTLPYIAGAPSDAYAEAHAVNVSGESAGWCDGGDGNRHATLWKGGKAYDLGLFGGSRSEADGMNDAGQVVGWYQTAPDADGNYQQRAFLWTPGATNGTTGTMIDLGVLPGGTSAFARDINNNGQIVGYAFSASAAGNAFIWDAAHGMRDLTKLITSISTEVQPNNDNYYLTDVHAINDNGQIAADFTLFISDDSTDHVSHGCLLDPGGAAVTKPAAPGNLQVAGGAQAFGGATAAATGKISLTWTDKSSNETSFVLQRRTGTGSFADLVTLAANTTSYTDGTVTVGTSYGYRVRAANSAGSSSYSNTATATAAAPTSVAISSLVLTPTSVTAGSTSSAKVTLAAVAPTGGATLTLQSSDTSSSTVPASVTIAAGNKSISFTVNTKTVTTTKTPTITATIGASTKTATLTITPAAGTVTVKSLTLSPTSVQGPASSTGTVTLTGAAPTGGLAVTLKSSDTSAATVAATLNIAAGATSAKFKITTKAVTSTKTVTITATGGGTGKTATLTVTGGTSTVTAKSLTATPNAVSSDGQTLCTVTLSGAAPSGGASVPVTLNGSAFYTATVSAGQTSASFTVTWGVVSSTSSNTLSASYGGKTVSATVTVSATSVTLKSYTFSPNPIVGGGTATAKVSLSGSAPLGGAVVTITYNGAFFYQFVIAAGATSGTYTQATSAVTATASYPFTATYNGASLSKTLTVTP